MCFQNEHLGEMEAFRTAGPTYPTEVIDEFATITLVRDCGVNDDTIINCPASALPTNYPHNQL